MFLADILAARFHPLGLGPAESMVVLVLLLVLFSGYALPEDRAHGGRLTRKELFLISTLGTILAVAVAIIVWHTLAP